SQRGSSAKTAGTRRPCARIERTSLAVWRAPSAVNVPPRRCSTRPAVWKSLARCVIAPPHRARLRATRAAPGSLPVNGTRRAAGPVPSARRGLRPGTEPTDDPRSFVSYCRRLLAATGTKPGRATGQGGFLLERKNSGTRWNWSLPQRLCPRAATGPRDGQRRRRAAHGEWNLRPAPAGGFAGSTLPRRFQTSRPFDNEPARSSPRSGPAGWDRRAAGRAPQGLRARESASAPRPRGGEQKAPGHPAGPAAGSLRLLSPEFPSATPPAREFREPRPRRAISGNPRAEN